MATLAELLEEGRRRLEKFSDSPRLDAELLLAQSLGKPRVYLLAWPERQPDATTRERYRALLERRLVGEPVAYLVGRQEFWSLDLAVGPATLIPRPDTERLVELALERLPPKRPLRVADLGTGSGAIALAIASERPHARVVATDLSEPALAVAAANARHLALSNVEFRQGDWCAALDGRFELIVSNPPYVAAADPHLNRGDLRFEPHAALTAGSDGLDALRMITVAALDWLSPGGWLLVEHGWDQGAAVAGLLRARGYAEVAGWRDLAGRDRVSGGRRPID